MWEGACVNCGSFSMCVTGAAGAGRMGRRPPLRRKKPPRAQQHTHCNRGANGQPAGGTQLRGTHTLTHTHHLYTGCFSRKVWFCNKAVFSSSRWKFPPTSRAVTLKPWPSWSTNTANYWLVSTGELFCECVCACVCVCFSFSLLCFPVHPLPQIIPLKHDSTLMLITHKSVSALSFAPFPKFSSVSFICLVSSLFLTLHILLYFLGGLLHVWYPPNNVWMHNCLQNLPWICKKTKQNPKQQPLSSFSYSNLQL